MTVVSAPLSADVTTGVLPGVVEDRIADLIGAMVAAAGGSYNATTGTITLPGTDPEVVRDTIVTALRAATGGMITITPNDAGDTITLGVDTAALSDSIAAGVAPKLDKGGGTMTGALVLAGPPTNALHAASQQYVLDQVAALLGGVTPADRDTILELATLLTADETTLATVVSALSTKQPLDDDLTALSALTTTEYGRGLLTNDTATAARTMLALGNVNNSSDANKPVSTAQQAAINAAVGIVVNIVADAGSTEALTTAAVHDLTLTAASCAVTLPSGMAQQAADLVLVMRQDSTGGRAVTFPGGVTWLGDGTQPALNTGPAGVTILTFFTVNGGTSWFGSGTVEQVPVAHKTSHAPGGTDAIDYTLVNRRGTLAARPAAAAANAGLTYFTTDERGGTNYRSDGTKWEQQGSSLVSALRPTALAHTTFPRTGATGIQAAHLVSGRRTLVAIDLPAGFTVNSITFVSGNTAAAAPTNQWFELLDAARLRLAVTADDGATAWAANATKTLALAAPFTTTYAGLHYLAVTVAATTVPTLIGVSGSAVLNGLAPIIVGTSDTGLTGPGTAPAGAAAIVATGNQPYAGVA